MPRRRANDRFNHGADDGNLIVIGEAGLGSFQVALTIPTQATAQIMANRPEDAPALPPGRHPTARARRRGPGRPAGRRPGLVRVRRGRGLIGGSYTSRVSDSRGDRTIVESADGLAPDVADLVLVRRVAIDPDQWQRRCAADGEPAMPRVDLALRPRDRRGRVRAEGRRRGVDPTT
jgi:hypothetical protein